MKTLRTTTHVSPDGRLALDLPNLPDMAGADVDVLVVLSPIGRNASGRAESTAKGAPDEAANTARWQSEDALGKRPSSAERRRLLNRVAGSIDDPTFERPPQGEYETREPLD